MSTAAVRIDIITIFPGYLAPLRESLIGKAIADGVIDLAVHDLRDWTSDPHRTVDDTPYGGGPGMVMRPDIWSTALAAVRAARPPVDGARPTLVIPTPSGRPFTQRAAAELAAVDHLVFACGRYEGIDARVADEAAETMDVREISIGDYVLAGGEAAALVIIEAAGRLLPGVLGNADSAIADSFATGMAGLLEGPVYTRPAIHDGRSVPDVLRSGDHAAITRWQRDESLRRTAAIRPDLLAALDAADCDERDLEVLDSIGAPIPAGLAARVQAERERRAAKSARRSRH